MSSYLDNIKKIYILKITYILNSFGFKFVRITNINCYLGDGNRKILYLSTS